MNTTVRTKKEAKELGFKTLDQLIRDGHLPKRGEHPHVVRGVEYFAPDQIHAETFATSDQWLTRWRFPKQGETGIEVLNVEYFAESQTEEVRTKSYAAKELRLTVSGAVPCAKRLTERGGYKSKSMLCEVYRVAELKPIGVQQKQPSEAIDLLLATWTVNRTTKRYRDASQALYASESHGLAQHARTTKESLYDLKDRGIAEAYLTGRLRFEGIANGMALYSGEGYCFHSRLVPKGQTMNVIDGEPLLVKSKGKSAAEARLCDAEFTLQQLRPDFSLFELLDPPAMTRCD